MKQNDMAGRLHLSLMSSKVEQLKEAAEWLRVHSEEFPAVNRNAKRILASVAMLQINLGADEA
ncbi:MAG TPA: hypothetical protein VK463_17425 [Desulfomonilaceae bacterium]|nr:hypothetical protein [Desulfomonilaceae bacterium]